VREGAALFWRTSGSVRYIRPVALRLGQRRVLVTGSAIVVALLAASLATAASPPLRVLHGRALRALGPGDSVLVGVRGGQASSRLVAAAGGRLLSRPGRLWLVPGTAARALVPRLETLGLLRYAELDRPREAAGHLSAGDPLLARAWQISRIGADKIEPPAGGVPLALVDTGLDVTNPDFAGRPDTTIENQQSIGPFRSEEYHGTIVASTAAAAANGVGTVGIQPFVPLRVWDGGNLDDSVLIPELDQVAAGCPQVVNMSFGGEENTRAFYEAVMRLVQAGCLVVAAAGNSFHQGSPTLYPADTPHVLTVGATEENDRPADFTSVTPSIDLAAPGVDIPVQDPLDPNDFALAEGTSFSAPIVSAVASWVWTSRPELDASQVFELLRHSARDIATRGFDTRTGFGVVDLPAALAAPAPPPDAAEPNDDVDLVKAGGVFRSAKPPLGPRLSATLDSGNDPVDVYRVVVPAHKTLTATVLTGRPLRVALWKSRTRSIRGPKANRLAVQTKPAGGRETVRFRNVGTNAATLYLEVALAAARAGTEASYTVTTRAR
jgi:hypothetical protein